MLRTSIRICYLGTNLKFEIERSRSWRILKKTRIAIRALKHQNPRDPLISIYLHSPSQKSKSKMVSNQQLINPIRFCFFWLHRNKIPSFSISLLSSPLCLCLIAMKQHLFNININVPPLPNQAYMGNFFNRSEPLLFSPSSSPPSLQSFLS